MKFIEAKHILSSNKKDEYKGLFKMNEKGTGYTYIASQAMVVKLKNINAFPEDEIGFYPLPKTETKFAEKPDEQKINDSVELFNKVLDEWGTLTQEKPVVSFVNPSGQDLKAISSRKGTFKDLKQDAVCIEVSAGSLCLTGFNKEKPYQIRIGQIKDDDYEPAYFSQRSIRMLFDWLQSYDNNQIQLKIVGGKKSFITGRVLSSDDNVVAKFILAGIHQ